MALPLIVKLLPAAQLAYEHRDKAAALFKKIKQWRNGDQMDSASGLTEIEPASIEEEVAVLKRRLTQRDEIMAEQSAIIAGLAKDVSELSTLTNKLRKRSQRMLLVLTTVIIISLIVWLRN